MSEKEKGKGKTYGKILKGLEEVEYLKGEKIPTLKRQIISYLAENKEAFARELEDELSARQPQVNKAVNYLADRDLIEKTPVFNGDKGAPSHLYNLKPGWRGKIYAEMEKRVKTLEEAMDGIFPPQERPPEEEEGEG